MIQLNASKGLGDAIYLRAIALHLIDRGDPVTVFTKWPDVYSDLSIGVRTLSAIVGNMDLRHSMYCLFCRIPAVARLDQFTMACLQVGITESVRLRLGWTVKDRKLTDRIKREASGRKVLVYQPVKKANNEEQELLRPRREAMRAHIESRADCYRVKVGHPDYMEPDDSPCELDLFGKTSIADLFDIATLADEFFTEASYLLILAEALNKPFTCMFSRRAVTSNYERIRHVTPDRIFHKKELAQALYDE